MIKRTFDITARIEQGQIPFCFQVVQNDKDVYMLHIRITDGGQEIDYGEISDATITFALANGSVVQSDPERLAISSGGITYEMGTTEISCPGKVTASIQLFGSSGERLTTARFQFEVVADLISPKAVQSESRFPLLQQLVADVEQLKQDIVDLQIPDNSIMDVKLSGAAGQIKQRLASHMAENASYATDYLAAYNVAYVSIPNGVSTILPFSTLAGGSKASLHTNNGNTITLPAGTWLVNVRVTFASNPTGYRSIEFARTDSTLAKGWVHAKVSANAVNGLDTTLEINRILNIYETRTYAVYVFQNSGSALGAVSNDANTLLSVRRIL